MRIFINSIAKNRLPILNVVSPQRNNIGVEYNMVQFFYQARQPVPQQ